MERLRRRLQIVISVSVVASGVLVCAILLWTKPTPPRRSDSNRVLDVAVVTVTPTVESTPILGHGTVRAKKQVDIVPQVSGLLVRVHEHLAQGKIIPKGEVLFEIDPTVYASRVRQAKAEVQGLEASLAGHDQEAKNLEARIANAQQMLAIDERDYQTSKNLFEQDKVGTARAVDMLEQKYLRQNGVLVELTSKRSMIPHLKLETAAKLEAARAKLNQTQHDLEHTTILCPFEARVEAVSANQSQVVTAHFSIAKLTDMEAFEIAVGIDPRELRWLDEAIRPQALESADSATAPTVKVRWSMQGQELSWEGRVTRFERVDEATRTARMVVEIRKADMVATVGDGVARPVPRWRSECFARRNCRRSGLSMRSWCRVMRSTTIGGCTCSSPMLTPRTRDRGDSVAGGFRYFALCGTRCWSIIRVVTPAPFASFPPATV
ncbi:MAG: biotin/lipoyl-binding protein [Planctomycetes bacterium]|nr:biotin/lipoyl-binding protein [Planctomycetota bacterium]